MSHQKLHAHERQAVQDQIDTLANKLRIAAAAGGATIAMDPVVCIYVARRLEGRPEQAPLIVRVDEFPAFWGWWLRLMACLVLADAAFRAGLALVRWIAAL